MEVIALRNVRKLYPMPSGAVEALRGITLSLEKGDFLAIYGPSGSGKSTLLHIMGLLDTPTSGQVILKGRDVSTLSEEERAALRLNYIGFVFQTFNLLPALTAWENVALPMALAGLPEEERRERAFELLAMVGLRGREEHKPSQLSGGQRQRVAIARALANRPAFILADEPTGNLDSVSGKAIMDLFRELNEGETTLVVVTHDPSVRDYARRVAFLKDGRIEKVVER